MSLEFFNEPVNSFTIMKYDADTRKPLAGAVIRVQKLGATTTFIGDFETGADGMIIINDLLPGAYSIQEIQAPPNYALDNTVRNISLEQNKPQVVTLYNSRYGDLLITKIATRRKLRLRE